MQQRSQKPGGGDEFLMAGIRTHFLKIPTFELDFGKQRRLDLPRKPTGHSKQRELAPAGVGRRAHKQWSGSWAMQDVCLPSLYVHIQYLRM